MPYSLRRQVAVCLAALVTLLDGARIGTLDVLPLSGVGIVSPSLGTSRRVLVTLSDLAEASATSATGAPKPRSKESASGARAPLLIALRGGSCFSSASRDEYDEASDDPPAPSEYSRRILVTGGCGFMGSYLVDRLVSCYEDYLIVVLDVLDECGSLQHLREALEQPNCVFVRGDVSSLCLSMPFFPLTR
jgi:hypothetical protein